MTEPTDPRVVEASGDDWLSPSDAHPIRSADGADHVASAPAGRRSVVTRVGLVAAGGLIGALVVTSLHHGASADPSTTRAPRALPGQPLNGVGGGGFGPGGRAGEQHLAGMLTDIGTSSVTVQTSDGTATYTVTSDTQIVRNGALTTLSALEVGDAVFVHVYPASSGSRLLVERIFAGTSATGGGGSGGPPGANATTTST